MLWWKSHTYAMICAPVMSTNRHVWNYSATLPDSAKLTKCGGTKQKISEDSHKGMKNMESLSAKSEGCNRWHSTTESQR